jgi:hypothetical protein
MWPTGAFDRSVGLHGSTKLVAKSSAPRRRQPIPELRDDVHPARELGSVVENRVSDENDWPMKSVLNFELPPEKTLPEGSLSPGD